ncbi:MAG: hypothetical protein MI924_01450 [Chloroflexales bacterium]|nr:hypothetical protein [Chloroflexales bacterium]
MGYVQRPATLTGARFVQTLLVGGGAYPRATRVEHAAAAAAVGVSSTAQGRDQRMTAVGRPAWLRGVPPPPRRCCRLTRSPSPSWRG